MLLRDSKNTFIVRANLTWGTFPMHYRDKLTFFELESTVLGTGGEKYGNWSFFDLLSLLVYPIYLLGVSFRVRAPK